MIPREKPLRSIRNIKRLAHICFRTNRFVQMTAFCGATLGLPQRFIMDLNDGSVFGRYFALGELSFFELFDEAGAAAMWGGTPTTRRQPTGAFYQHFCIEVEGLESFRASLAAKGTEVGPIKSGMDGSLQCWLKDPDGNSIELMECTAKSKQLG